MKRNPAFCAFPALMALSLFISICMINGTARAAEKELKTAIVSAAVYNGQAQIVRRGEVALQPGRVKLMCRDLPGKFIESSLLVEGSGTSKTRIVGIDLVRQESSARDSDRYKELTANLERLTGAHKNLAVEKEAIEARRALLNSMEEFSTDQAHAELSRQAFSIQEWRKLLDFYQTERERIGKEMNAIAARIDTLEKKISWTRSEIRLMDAGESFARSVAIDCEVESAGSMTIDLSYLVPDASWTPEYTILFDESSERIEIAYNAKIRQATGEDWKGVAVILSTAEPHVGAAPPVLFPLTVALFEGTSTLTGTVIDAGTGRPLAFANVVIIGSSPLLGAMTQPDGTYRIVNVPAGAYEVKAMMMGYGASKKGGVLVSPGRDVYVNFALEEGIVGRTQEIVVEAQSPVGELHVRGGRSQEVQQQIDETLPALAPLETSSPLYFEQAGVASGEFTANLQIKMPLDLESGAEPKRALIVRERLGGTVSRHTVPSLSERVFLEGDFENSIAAPLLPGFADVYVETTPPGTSSRVSTFVGREAIVGVAPEQTFSMHLGIDQSVKVTHKLEKKEYLPKASRKTSKIRYEYLITLESFRKDSSTVRVEDRVPTSANEHIKVTDVEITPVPAEQKENGLVTWNVPVPPGGKVSIRMAYTLTFPADRTERQIMFRE